MHLRTAAAAAALLCWPPPSRTASADTLFENPSAGGGTPGNNLISTANSLLRQYGLSQFVVGGQGWNIDRVSMLQPTATARTDR